MIIAATTCNWQHYWCFFFFCSSTMRYVWDARGRQWKKESKKRGGGRGKGKGEKGACAEGKQNLTPWPWRGFSKCLIIEMSYYHVLFIHIGLWEANIFVIFCKRARRVAMEMIFTWQQSQVFNNKQSSIHSSLVLFLLEKTGELMNRPWDFRRWLN